MRQAESREAIKDYDEAIRLNPQSAEAYFKRGFFYQNLGQGEQAIEDFDKAIRIDSQFAKAYSNRAYAYLNKGHYGQTIADCTSAIKLDPNDAVSCLNRGVVEELREQLIVHIGHLNTYKKDPIDESKSQTVEDHRNEVNKLAAKVINEACRILTKAID